MVTANVCSRMHGSPEKQVQNTHVAEYVTPSAGVDPGPQEGFTG